MSLLINQVKNMFLATLLFFHWNSALLYWDIPEANFSIGYQKRSFTVSKSLPHSYAGNRKIKVFYVRRTNVNSFFTNCDLLWSTSFC